MPHSCPHRPLFPPRTQRQQRTDRLRRRYLRRTRPPSHPLLVYGADLSALQHARSPEQRGRQTTIDAALASAAVAPGGAIASAGPSLVLVTQLVERLLMMLVTDPDPAIRFELCHALGPAFDALLASESNLLLLFSGLQDENYGVREAALALVGRLAPRNPALILPALRRTLIHTLAELEHADVQVRSAATRG